MKKILASLFAATLLISSSTAFAAYDFAYSSGADFGGDYSTSWGSSDLNYDTSTYGSGYSNSSGSSGSIVAPVVPSQIPVVPEGAIGVEILPSGNVYCFEFTSAKVFTAMAQSDQTIKDTANDVVIGEVTIYDADAFRSYGHIYPYKMASGESGVSDNCYRTDFVSQEEAVPDIVPTSTADNTSTDTTPTSTAVDLSVKTRVNVDATTGVITHFTTGVEIFDATYDATADNITLDETGYTYGVKVDGQWYINVDSESFEYFYGTGTGDESADTQELEAMTTGDPGPEAMVVNTHSNDFTDVTDEAYYKDAVWYGASEGWVKYDNNFRPGDNMTRCEFAKVLLVANEVSIGQPGGFFPDVNASHWASAYVETGYNEGYWGGLSDGSFGCDKNVTRAEATKMISNAIGMTELDEDDYIPGDSYPEWALPFIKRMHKHGFMTGNGTSYNANGNILRAEALTVLYRIFSPDYIPQ